uniref:ATP synthase epsilon chain n=1 Tax=Candidatus Kentrum sp. TUN TaxID=2126343 RepID=A0A451A341_9GAMM|nr:MAG: ATP synthase F1 subcomplex epsilon subunit [Candidatus Kentron sp. TUN]VFK55368.1 MAG: ATP synthase F1 subcomplex epsilon subunit [Candidatus Kentron sp. TUN]VFK60441.1 MAG: ATP synthase F1 subcomplex epsilon subunit [Candidatus Kentron sp. TUN]
MVINNDKHQPRIANTIYVDVVSAEGMMFTGPAHMVIAPAIMGEIGILPGHSPLLTELRSGEMRIKLSDEDELSIYVSGGLLEVQPSIVTVLADTALRTDIIDNVAAAAAKKLAEENKRNTEKAIRQGMSTFDYAKAKQELAQAIAQIRALDELQKRNPKKGTSRSR